MKYPSRSEIEQADRIKICRWYRYLPFPGANHYSKRDFPEVCRYEASLMDRINERFTEMGGMTPEISKLIRYDNRGI
jgi:hypothetical protein